MQDGRRRILDAATRVLIRDGGDAVTIAAVAREAEISKGGLFYHFASKELLIEGLVGRYVDGFDADLRAAPDGPGSATLAYLRSASTAASAGGLMVPLLAAAAANTVALELLRTRYRAWQKRLDDDGIPREVAAIVRFAADGLWAADALDLAPAGEQDRGLILERLERLVREAARDTATVD